MPTGMLIGFNLPGVGTGFMASGGVGLW